MALPKLETGTRHETTLPSNGQKVTYRPFLVKEEKIILQALNSESEEEMMQAIKNVAENCTFGKLDVDVIPFVDLEWIFLKLRMRSKGEVVEAKYRCKNKVPDVDKSEDLLECGHINEIELDLEQVKVENTEKGSNNIVLQETGPIGMTLKYPTKEFAEKWQKKSGDPMVMFDMLLDSIESVYNGEEVFYHADIDKDELMEWVDEFTETQFKKINDFFASLPKLTYDFDFSCSKCGYKKHVKLEGLKSFLG